MTVGPRLRSFRAFPPFPIASGAVAIDDHRRVMLSAITSVWVEDVVDWAYIDGTGVEPEWTVQISVLGVDGPLVYAPTWGDHYHSPSRIDAMLSRDELIARIAQDRRNEGPQ